ncbi:MAG: DNA primase catalytic subunit PriS, partial [Candidatus Heimdallarchaeaceae archaeon]
MSDYYREKFPMDFFMSFIGLSDFQNREFGFVVKGNRFIRNTSFANTEEFRDFMVKKSVFHAYVGAVYEKPPSKENPIQKNKWKYREFIFDIDIDEYDLVRTCGCKGDQYCKDCWSLIQDAAIFIEETMKEDFGFKNMVWIFSGRRGVHGWIVDSSAKYFEQLQRVAILNYLTFIHDKTRSQSIAEIPNEAKPLRNRIYTLIAKAYLEKAKPEKLRDMGMSLNKARTIIKEVKNSANFDHNKYNILIPDNSAVRKRLSKEIIVRRFPRIDRKVTMDTRRVSRIPYSVHGKTGQIAIVIKDIEKFYPDSAP